MKTLNIVLFFLILMGFFSLVAWGADNDIGIVFNLVVASLTIGGFSLAAGSYSKTEKAKKKEFYRLSYWSYVSAFSFIVMLSFLKVIEHMGDGASGQMGNLVYWLSIYSVIIVYWIGSFAFIYVAWKLLFLLRSLT